MTRPTLTEPPWTMAELKHAISRLKVGRAGDYLGLVAELLKHSPDDFFERLAARNDPSAHKWKCPHLPGKITLFRMAAENKYSKVRV